MKVVPIVADPGRLVETRPEHSGDGKEEGIPGRSLPGVAQCEAHRDGRAGSRDAGNHGKALEGADLQGHGHTLPFDRPMTFEAMADDVAGNDRLRIERELPEPQARAQMVRDVLRSLGTPTAPVAKATEAQS